MSKTLKLFSIGLIFSLISSTFAFACEDGTLYLQCQDQQLIYAQALQRADSANKNLVVVLGYETCPWCQSLGRIFNDFEENNIEISSQLEFVEIAAYSYDRFSQKFDEVVSGTNVGNLLVSQMETPSEIIGFPVIFVTNPKTKKTVMINTGDLEENDEARGVYGHNTQRVMEALKKANSAI